MAAARAGIDGFAEGMRGGFLEFLNNFGLAPGIYNEAAKQAQLGPDDPPLEPTNIPAYLLQLETMIATDCFTMFVRWDDIKDWNAAFASKLEKNYFRSEPALRRAVQNFVQQHDPEMAKESHDSERRDREFFVSVFDGIQKASMRELRVEKVGHLTCFQGTITRTSEVRPELYLGAFRCGECSTVVRGVEQQFKYSPPLICANANCGNRKFWKLVREESVFVDWQKLKVQENNEEVPAGSLPRTMDVILRHNMVETAKAGDKMLLTGSLVVVPDVAVLSAPGERAVVSQGGQRNAATSAEGLTGLKSLGARELTYKLMFIATHTAATNTAEGMVNIRSEVDEAPQEVLDGFENNAYAEEVLSMSTNPLIYARLARSMCPSVYGHESIKQAVLLMLLGGVHKKTPEGINLRGDINVAIVGDPSCAKSQILKYVAGFLPRAVYTSGKASTAAGLTASVVREPDTNEFAIEAGALMLANNGVCCIDEFDKMDVKDQVAIHEAMEQQTISISKAGVQATLNARTSILAAANPVGGRYDKSKPLKYNVSLPPAILSRFDLLHIMVDDTTEVTDQRIAEFIIRVHRFQARAWDVPYTQEQMQRYIKYARAHRPTISAAAHEALVKAYRDLRCEDAAPGTNTAYRITVRQLEAMIRLSEAIARLHCTTVITPVHVAEAKRLLKASILKIEQSDVDLDDFNALDMDPEDVAVPEPAAAAAGDAMEADDDVENDAGAANGAGASVGRKRTAGEDAARDAKRSRTTATPPAAASQPTQDAPAAAAPPPAPASRTKVTAAKFEYVKNMIVKRLLDEEKATQARRDASAPSGSGGAAPPFSATDASTSAAQGDEGGAYGFGGETDAAGAAGRDVDGGSSAGMPQSELLRWYNDIQVDKGLLSTMDEQLEEFSLVSRIVNHLIKKDQVLAVVSRPERQVTEEEDAYLKRVQSERVLCLHSNYAPDV